MTGLIARMSPSKLLGVVRELRMGAIVCAEHVKLLANREKKERFNSQALDRPTTTSGRESVSSAVRLL